MNERRTLSRNPSLGVACLLLVALGLVACDGDADDPSSAANGPGGASTGSGAASAGGGAVGGGGSGGGQGGGALTVRTVDAASGAALADVPVVVSSVDGSLAASVVSGPDGEVEVAVPAGGSVSVLWAYDELTTYFSPALRTVREVRSFYPTEADLELEVHLEPGDFLPAEAMDVSFEVSPVEGATDYTLLLSCGVTGFVGGSNGLATLKGYWGCPGEDSFDAVLLASNADGPVAYAVQKDVPFVGGSEVTLDLDVAAAPFVDVDFDTHGAFGDEMQVSLDSVGDAKGPRIPGWATHAPATKDLSGTVKAAPGYASSYCWKVDWKHEPDTKPTSGEAQLGCSDALPEAIEFDGGRLAMPAMEATRSTASFALPADAEQGDGLELRTQQGIFDDEQHWRWSAVRALPATGAFVFPELPAGHAAFAPRPNGFAMRLDHLDLLDADAGFIQAMAATPEGTVSRKHSVELAFTADLVE